MERRYTASSTRPPWKRIKLIKLIWKEKEFKSQLIFFSSSRIKGLKWNRSRGKRGKKNAKKIQLIFFSHLFNFAQLQFESVTDIFDDGRRSAPRHHPLRPRHQPRLPPPFAGHRRLMTTTEPHCLQPVRHTHQELTTKRLFVYDSSRSSHRKENEPVSLALSFPVEPNDLNIYYSKGRRKKNRKENKNLQKNKKIK